VEPGQAYVRVRGSLIVHRHAGATREGGAREVGELVRNCGKPEGSILNPNHDLSAREESATHCFSQTELQQVTAIALMALDVIVVNAFVNLSSAV
jgi:hypothetical protein